MSSDKCSLLIVDDESYLLPTLSALLAQDFEVATADSADKAQAIFAQQPVDILLTDQKMPKMTGVQLLEWSRSNYPKTIRLLMTGYVELDDAIDAINRGQVYHYLMKPWRTEDLLRVLTNAAEKFHLERSNEKLLGELARKNTELNQFNAELESRVAERTRELEERAQTDPLTGLPHHQAIEDKAHAEFNRQQRYGGSLAFGVIDLDHFRNINTTYGHPGGSEVIKSLVQVLAHCLRGVDTLGRWGGEEFLVVAPETDVEGAQALAERIRVTVEKTPIPCHGQSVYLTVSVGFAVVLGKTAFNHVRFLEVADAAMYEAKQAGRNRSVVRTV